MQPAFQPGTILQTRYRLTKVLGQGGFGRTYLAEDQSRFNEACVLKEYNPQITDDYVLNKSQDLFAREAKVLYQIQHPQIPRFLASFEQGGRFFLVQDYVEGKTYRRLLAERLPEKRFFSEWEMSEFLQQILPILEYIHSQGIIHRDIAPDNIICRADDQRPVLIDFGVVKAGAYHFETSQNHSSGTAVGKIGYAPPEQLQTGTVYPNSDLYALAVTVVVLMTGKKPQELFDESSMSWRWHQWVPTLSTRFAQILNKMLSPRPNNRYQSANEVLLALRAISGLVSAEIIASPLSADQKSVNRNSASKYRKNSRPRTSKNSFLGNQTGISKVIIGGILIFIAVAPMMLVGSFFPTIPAKKTADTDVDNNSITTPNKTPSNSHNEIITYTETLNLLPGQKALLERSIKNREITYFIIKGKAGQKLSATITNGEVLMTIWLNQEIVENGQDVAEWTGILPAEGDYYVEINIKEGLSEVKYNLDVSLVDGAEPQNPNIVSPPNSQSNSTSPSP